MSLETTTNIPHAGDVVDELVIIFRDILSKVIKNSWNLLFNHFRFFAKFPNFMIV